MRTNRYIKFVLLIITLISAAPSWACTTGLAAGEATADGRCLLWKNRDSSFKNNEMVFLTRGEFQLIGVINADDTTQIWAGVNTFGFAIMNAESRDLAKPDENTIYDEEGYLMKAALFRCKSVAEFEIFLQDYENRPIGVTSNFGVIDAHGEAAFFETGNSEYFRYDASDMHVCPTAFLARANFAEHAYNEESYGHGRFQDATDLANSKAAVKELAVPHLVSEVTRDISTLDESAPDTTLFYTGGTVNRHRTVSTSIFESTLPGEDPRLATYWITLGEPSVSVSVPLWVYAGEVPAAMDGDGGAELNLLFQELKAYVYPDSNRPEYISAARLAEVQKQTDRIQAWVFKKTERQLKKWRKKQPLPEEVDKFQNMIIKKVIGDLKKSFPN